MKNIFACCLWLLLFAFSRSYGNENIYLLTVPKSGTHLTLKYIKLLQYRGYRSIPNIRRSHFSENRLDLPNGFLQNSDVKKIVVIRDLRDVFISTLNHIEMKRHFLTSKVRFANNWENLCINKKLQQLIDYRENSTDILWDYKNRTIAQQLHLVIKRAIDLPKNENCAIIRFERLIGHKGVKAQLSAFHKINQFLNIRTSKADEMFIRNHLFGNNLFKSATYYKGYSGRWKKIFNQKTINLMKEVYGEELIEFGYEEDLNWSNYE